MTNNEQSNTVKTTKLYAFPGNRGEQGSISSRPCYIKCTQCGNDLHFKGTAMTYPSIQIEKITKNQYEVLEISYEGGPSVDERVDRCGVCGSLDIEVKYLED